MMLILGILLGFFFWKQVSGKYEGDKIERSWRPLIHGYYVHIHHWIWGLLLLVLALLFDIHTPLIVGLLIGSILQGLTYRDRFVIVYKKENFETIYARFK
jgi:hypothetical protein